MAVRPDMMVASNPYVLLAVAADASPEEIRVAYRQAARRHHPDFGGDAAIFIAVKSAFDLLSDPGRRATFDAEHAPVAAGRNREEAAGDAIWETIFHGHDDWREPPRHDDDREEPGLAAGRERTPWPHPRPEADAPYEERWTWCEAKAGIFVRHLTRRNRADRREMEANIEQMTRLLMEQHYGMEHGPPPRHPARREQSRQVNPQEINR